ncbi:MAG: glycosyltransferase, partial [Acidobacteriota bacterium]
HTHLLLAQRLAVDVPSMAEAIARLAGDPVLRREMGRRASAAMAGYSWESIAARHVELWERLWAQPAPRPGTAAHPVAVPYAAVFGSYPSHSLETSPPLVLSRLGNAVYRGQDFPVVYEGLEGVLPMEALRPMLVLARKPLPALALCERLRTAVPQAGEEQARALVLWCLKHDLLERSRG